LGIFRIAFAIIALINIIHRFDKSSAAAVKSRGERSCLNIAIEEENKEKTSHEVR